MDGGECCRGAAGSEDGTVRAGNSVNHRGRRRRDAAIDVTAVDLKTGPTPKAKTDEFSGPFADIIGGYNAVFPDDFPGGLLSKRAADFEISLVPGVPPLAKARTIYRATSFSS